MNTYVLLNTRCLIVSSEINVFGVILVRVLLLFRQLSVLFYFKILECTIPMTYIRKPSNFFAVTLRISRLITYLLKNLSTCAAFLGTKV